jgi:hypothetical protein
MTKNPQSRVFRTSNKSQASIYLEDNAVSIIGDSRNFIVCDDRGVTIKGPVSFVSDAMGRRQAGLFVGISDFLETIPQTLITPFPSRIPFPPVFAVANIVKDVAFFMSLLI